MTKISIETKIKAIEEWVDYYNHRRIQTKLCNLTPLQYEAQLVA
ncbi:IS3 family transposase [Limosilactobacillus allomucosae]